MIITEKMLKECCERVIEEIQGTMKYLSESNGYMRLQFGKCIGREKPIVEQFGKYNSNDLSVYMELRNEYIRDHFTEIFSEEKIQSFCKKFNLKEESLPQIIKQEQKFVEVELTPQLDIHCVKGSVHIRREERKEQSIQFGGIYYALFPFLGFNYKTHETYCTISRRPVIIVQRRRNPTSKYILVCPITTDDPGQSTIGFNTKLGLNHATRENGCC